MTDPPPGSGIRVERASPDDLETCFALRRRVFVDEQGVPADEEVDAHDAGATHWLAWGRDRALGTARARAVDGWAKAERVAVVGAARGAGVGRALMDAVEDWARCAGLRGVVLHAQAGAIPFDRALGYREEGPVFEEAGIPHRVMRRTFRGVVPAA